MGSLAPSPPPQQLSLGDLKALSVLGQGARGVVFHVVPVATGPDGCNSEPGNPVAMALKAMSRAAARHRGHGPGGAHGGGGADGHRRIWFERDVLLALHHPLLPSLRGVVATDAVVGFAMDRCPGGDLKSLIRRRRTAFPDSVIRFYAAELVLALEHLHGLGVVYRDLKPENVLIQGSGHIMLVDFDLSTTLPPPPPPPPPDAASSPSLRHHLNRKKNKNKVAAMIFACLSSSSRHAAASSESSTYQTPQSTTSRTASSSSGCGSSGPAAKSRSFVGTEDYVAPEIVAGSGHDHAVDWWGLGVVLYEMLYGRTPFRGRSRRETFRRVLAAPPELPAAAGDDGDDGRAPLRDLIARLLDKDPARRLGARGVRRHAFFRGVDWDRVLDVARPPFIPAPDDDDDTCSGDGAAVVALDVEKVVGEVFGSEMPLAKAVGSEDVTDDDDFSVFF
ncbi:hypothetical protein EJB05_20933, partial [Eragrostis curvula]